MTYLKFGSTKETFMQLPSKN